MAADDGKNGKDYLVTYFKRVALPEWGSTWLDN